MSELIDTQLETRVEDQVPQHEQIDTIAALGSSVVANTTEQVMAAEAVESPVADTTTESATRMLDGMWSRIARQMITERGL